MTACPRGCGGSLSCTWSGACTLCGRGEIAARPPTLEELAVRAKVRDEKKLHRLKMNQRRCVAARKARQAV